MAEHDITLRFLTEPSDVNFGGKVHGGQVMKWIDHAGYSCAANWSGCYCVTAYVGGIQFVAPINVGDLVTLHAELMYTGRSSMHISVSVHARNPRYVDNQLTTHCILVFVALDDDGAKAPVPTFQPSSVHEQRLNTYARRMIELREAGQTEAQAFENELRNGGADHDPAAE
ncbi:acyl-CoA thioesterase [Salinisphaera orenii]|uniref:acyl-CoA thioesterase n=1 Tax=Salinisphaera orenii TaxID=856731 RepID=UPI000DBE93EB